MFVIDAKLFNKKDDALFSSSIGEVFFIFLFVAIPRLLITGAMYLGWFLVLAYNFRRISNIYANIGIAVLVAFTWFLMLQLCFGEVVYALGHPLLSESLHTIDVFYLFFSLIAYVQINITCVIEMPDE